MSGSELPRPELRDVVTVDLAEVELAAVRALLDELRDDVHAEERAATHAEDQATLGIVPVAPPVGPAVEAIQISRQIVEDMADARRAQLSADEQEVYRQGQARVFEAQRRAEDLAAAARRDAGEILRQQLENTTVAPAAAATTPVTNTVPAPAPAVTAPVPDRLNWATAADGGAGWTDADEEWLDAEADGEDDLTFWGPPPADPEPALVAPRWSAPLPPLQHWAEPAPATLPASVPAAAVRERDPVAAAHEQFWQEEAQASSARSGGMSPIEVLLPTAALLLLLLAALVLIR